MEGDDDLALARLSGHGLIPGQMAGDIPISGSEKYQGKFARSSKCTPAIVADPDMVNCHGWEVFSEIPAGSSLIQDGHRLGKPRPGGDPGQDQHSDGRTGGLDQKGIREDDAVPLGLESDVCPAPVKAAFVIRLCASLGKALSLSKTSRPINARKETS